MGDHDVRRDYWEILRSGNNKASKQAGQSSSDEGDANEERRHRKAVSHEQHRKHMDKTRDSKLEKQKQEMLKQTKKMISPDSDSDEELPFWMMDSSIRAAQAEKLAQQGTDKKDKKKGSSKDDKEKKKSKSKKDKKRKDDSSRKKNRKEKKKKDKKSVKKSDDKRKKVLIAPGYDYAFSSTEKKQETRFLVERFFVRQRQQQFRKLSSIPSRRRSQSQSSMGLHETELRSVPTRMKTGCGGYLSHIMLVELFQFPPVVCCTVEHDHWKIPLTTTCSPLKTTKSWKYFFLMCPLGPNITTMNELTSLYSEKQG
ncbi:unnamed protein product, partial [Amoebophrya sp. A25]|eukprot:GSA25T00012494001.1